MLYKQEDFINKAEKERLQDVKGSRELHLLLGHKKKKNVKYFFKVTFYF